MTLLAQDLYNNSNGADSPVTGGGFTFLFPEINLVAILSYINFFALAWTLFVSFIFISDFYFYFRRFSDGESPREKKGVKSLWLSLHSWWRYLICIGFFVLTALTSELIATILGIITIILYIIKFWVDLRDLLGLSDYFSWYKNLTSPILKVLNFKIQPPKKKK